MVFRNLAFELNEEQIASRHSLALSLMKEKEVQAFCETYECPFEIVEANASRFKKWLSEYRRVSQLTKEDVEDNPLLGAYFDLEYDKDTMVLDEIYKEISFVRELQEDYAYLKQYQIFDLSLNMRDAHFDHLDLSNEGVNYLKIYKELQGFISDKQLGYFLYGQLGVGKSYLAACVSNAFAKKNKRVAFVHVPSLFNHLKQLFNAPQEMEFCLNVLRKVPLLVLDDLGAEPITSWSRDEILLSVLNDRLENKRKTIITSNATPEMLLELYSLDSKGVSDGIRAARFVDRIKALTKSYEIVGINRRNQ